MTIDDYAREKAKQARPTCLHCQSICLTCVERLLVEAYAQGCADQKRGAVAALSNVPRRGSATSVVALITYRDAIKAVQASQPESGRGAGEGK